MVVRFDWVFSTLMSRLGSGSVVWRGSDAISTALACRRPGVRYGGSALILVKLRSHLGGPPYPRALSAARRA
jgi:hypothetical protein